jgi:hypothetical protein
MPSYFVGNIKGPKGDKGDDVGVSQQQVDNTIASHNSSTTSHNDIRLLINTEKTAREDADTAEITARNAAISTAVGNEATARDAAIAAALENEESAISQLSLHSVALKTDLPDPSTLNSKYNYKCRVMNGADRGIYRLTAGTTAWTLFDDSLDWITVAAAAALIAAHNDDMDSHEDLIAAVKQTVAGWISAHDLDSAAHGDIRAKIGNDLEAHNDASNAHSTLLAAFAKLASPALTGNPTAPTQAFNAGLDTANKTKLATLEYVERAAGILNFLKLTNSGVGVNIKIDDDTLTNGTEIIFDLLYNETASGTLVTEAIIHGQIYIGANGDDTRHGFVSNSNRNINIYFYKDSDGCHNLYISRTGANYFPSIKAAVYGAIGTELFKPLPLVITAVTTTPTGMTKINDNTFAPDRSLDGKYLLSRPDLWPNGEQVLFPNKLAGIRFSGSYNTGAANANVVTVLGDDTIFPNSIKQVLEYGGHAGGTTNSTAVQFPVNCNSQYFSSNSITITNIIALKTSSTRILTFNHKDAYAPLDTVYDFWVKYVLS